MNHLYLNLTCVLHKEYAKNILYTISYLIPPARGFKAQEQVQRKVIWSTHQYSEEQRLDLRVCENVLVQKDVGLGHGHFA